MYQGTTQKKRFKNVAAQSHEFKNGAEMLD